MTKRLTQGSGLLSCEQWGGSGKVKELIEFSKVPMLFLCSISSLSWAANHHGCGELDAMTFPSQGGKLIRWPGQGATEEQTWGETG